MRLIGHPGRGYTTVAGVLAIVGACGRDAPPFTFVLAQDASTVLLEADFASYDDGVAAGPFTVVVTSRTTSGEVTMSVGTCASAAPCAGPISFERLVLTVEPSLSDHLLGFDCEGLDGTLSSGIDVMGSGDCAR